ncbi:hypothetical protein KKB10_01590 [Patescibacteria group bacterium]|nr:hypothetical protein [Patescibacteria group bacterium]MBU1074987.1 hypothetical protein [Patescibacteria group bacterium]MBU1951308.1 hypothetical protein [Patescibacteria group bacterium]
MVETSKDVLFLVIALCVFIVTVFFVWIMYYIAQILKSSKEMVEEVKNKVEEFGNLLTTLREKVTHSTTMLSTVAKGVTDLLSMFKEKRSRRKDEYEEEYEEEEAVKKSKRKKRK